MTLIRGQEARESRKKPAVRSKVAPAPGSGRCSVGGNASYDVAMLYKGLAAAAAADTDADAVERGGPWVIIEVKGDN